MEDLKLWFYYLQLVHQHHVSSPPMTELLAGTHGSNGVYHTENRYANSLLSLYEKVDQIYQKRSWKDEQAPCICLDKAILLKVYISEGTSSTSAAQQMRQECSRKRNKSNAAIFVKYNRRDSRGMNQRSIDYTGLKPAYHSMSRSDDDVFIAGKRGLKALTSLTCTSSNYAHSVASQWSTPVYTFVHCVKLPLWRFVSKTSFTNFDDELLLFRTEQHRLSRCDLARGWWPKVAGRTRTIPAPRRPDRYLGIWQPRS
ncbi:hypothetical protein T05_15455, partial [Trichinella murrelli]